MRFADPNRGSATERGYGYEWTKKVRQIRQRDHDLCQPCVRRANGYIGTYSAIDHKVPKSLGGSDHDSNLQCICEDCHKAKTAAESRGLVWSQTG